tara:strand:+ start:378 stop:713 length:336 start_codon:yes stop_codon:yes gene_type:complete
MYLINLLDNIVIKSKNKTIKKQDIINIIKQNGGVYDIDNLENSFCGYHLTQCYNPPKPCMGCDKGGGKKKKTKKINKTKFNNYIKNLVNKRYPNYKITYHSINLLNSLYNN